MHAVVNPWVGPEVRREVTLHGRSASQTWHPTAPTRTAWCLRGREPPDAADGHGWSRAGVRLRKVHPMSPAMRERNGQRQSLPT